MNRYVFFLYMLLATSLHAQHSDFIGDWALDLPNQEVGWLAVRENGTQPNVELLWGVGSQRPIEKFEIVDGKLVFNRNIKRPLSPKEEPAISYRIEMYPEGEDMFCTMNADGQAVAEFRGVRQPALPPKPDASKVAWGTTIMLFNGKDLSGWSISNPSKKNGWSARDGILCNDTPKTDFSAYGEFANLRTDREFDDFQFHIEYRLPKPDGGNSGIYLRGMYETQVTHRDSRMQGINGPGAIFGRISPTHNAGKPAGEWEAVDITLLDRHVTVVLNGDKVIDTQPIAGPTGGALKNRVNEPGPIYLQGDHTSVQYRNIMIQPAKR